MVAVNIRYDGIISSCLFAAILCARGKLSVIAKKNIGKKAIEAREKQIP